MKELIYVCDLCEREVSVSEIIGTKKELYVERLDLSLNLVKCPYCGVLDNIKVYMYLDENESDFDDLEDAPDTDELDDTIDDLYS